MARSNTKISTHKKSPDKTPLPKLSQPAMRALANAGYDHLEQLADVCEASLLELHGFGPNALVKLREALSEIGLSLFVSQSSATIPSAFADLWCADRMRQGDAFKHILELTSQPVDWAYEVWDELLEQLSDKNNRNRAIAAQVLCNLAKSDPKQRMLRDFAILFDVVHDERFVTARHTMQSMWKIGCLSKKYQDMLLAALEKRFADCVTHKNYTLIRYDIIECLRKLYDGNQSDVVRATALQLIETETDPKYKKKYTTLWPNSEQGKLCERVGKVE